LGAKTSGDMIEKKPDQALLGAEQHFRRLVQGVTDYAIFMLDPEGHVTSWNAGAERIKGYAPDDIIGEHFSRFYTPEDFDSGVPSRALETARETGRYEAEGWRVRKDGTRFWASAA
jgi:PAS domain S-box-containing protein